MNGIANSGTGTVRIPPGVRLFDLRFLTTIAGVLSDPATVIDWIRVTVNKTQIIDTTPAKLIAQAKLARITPSTGECPLYLAEPWKPAAVVPATAWPLNGADEMVVTVKFLNPGGGAVGLTIQQNFDTGLNIDPATKAPFLRILKRSTITQNVPSGQSTITNIDTSFPIERIFLTPSTGSISTVTVEADSQVFFEATKQENADILNSSSLTASFVEFPLVFDRANRGESLICNSLVLKPTCGSANTLTIDIVQRVNGWR